MNPTMPAGLTLVRTTPEFTPETVPHGLLGNHKVAVGVWGRLCVLEGTVLFFFEGPAGAVVAGAVVAGEVVAEPIVVTPLGPVHIPPDTAHRIDAKPGSRFVVEFYR